MVVVVDAVVEVVLVEVVEAEVVVVVVVAGGGVGTHAAAAVITTIATAVSVAVLRFERVVISRSPVVVGPSRSDRPTEDRSRTYDKTIGMPNNPTIQAADTGWNDLPSHICVGNGPRLTQMATTYRTSQVAELLGVSSDTVRRWCDDGRLPSSGTGRQRTIAGEDLAAHLRERGPAFGAATDRVTSARNRFTGIVTRVERDGLVAVVEICAPPHRVVSMMTREAADELELAPGDLASAVIKATNVVVELP